MKIFEQRHLNPEYCKSLEEELDQVEHELFGNLKERSMDDIINEIHRLREKNHELC